MEGNIYFLNDQLLSFITKKYNSKKKSDYLWQNTFKWPIKSRVIKVNNGYNSVYKIVSK